MIDKVSLLTKNEKHLLRMLNHLRNIIQCDDIFKRHTMALEYINYNIEKVIAGRWSDEHSVFKELGKSKMSKMSRIKSCK